VPTQFPSSKQAAFFSTVVQYFTAASITMIVIALILQIIAKKVISFMWLYYAAL
jgi:hypothetical protein